jgi:hypothetical protein
MGMTPEDFFQGFVEMDHDDWREAPSDIRRAFHAAVSAFHLADHYYRYHARRNEGFLARYRNLGEFQKALAQRAPLFKVIQDMANAYKHLYTYATCSIASGGSIESMKYSGGTIEQDWPDAQGDMTSGIIIRRRDKSVIRFNEAIDAVIEMWRSVMYAETAPAL